MPGGSERGSRCCRFPPGPNRPCTTSPSDTSNCYATIRPPGPTCAIRPPQRRDHHDCRLAVLADSNRQAGELLRSLLDGESRPGMFNGRKPYGRDLKIAFVYDGQAESWKPHLARLAACPVSTPRWRKSMPCCNVWRAGPWQPCSTKPRVGTIPRMRGPRPGGSATGAGGLVAQLGITPDVVLGQGVGELAAACGGRQPHRRGGLADRRGDWSRRPREDAVGCRWEAARRPGFGR